MWGNLAKIAVLVGLFRGYFVYVPDPMHPSLVRDLLIVPVLFGATSYTVLKGDFFTRIAYVAAVPVIAILLLSGDPAKPTIHLMLIGPFLVMFCLGAGIVAAMGWLIGKNRSSNSKRGCP